MKKQDFNYSDLKKLDKIYTHSGMFHSDDVLCCAFLKTINPEIEIVRVSELTNNILNESNSIIVDIGGVKFDHHLNRNDTRDKGIFEDIKYSSIGLLWKEFGRDFIEEKFSQHGVDFESKEIHDNAIEEIFEDIDENYIGVIDYVDNNGPKRYEKSFQRDEVKNDEAEKLTISVRNSNINWYDRKGLSLEEKEKLNNDRFIEVVNCVNELFNDSISNYLELPYEKEFSNDTKNFIERSNPEYSKFSGHLLEAYEVLEEKLADAGNGLIINLDDPGIPANEVNNILGATYIRVSPSDRGGFIVLMSNCASNSQNTIDAFTTYNRQNSKGEYYFIIAPNENNLIPLLYSLQFEIVFSNFDIPNNFEPIVIKNIFDFYNDNPELFPADLKYLLYEYSIDILETESVPADYEDVRQFLINDCGVSIDIMYDKIYHSIFNPKAEIKVEAFENIPKIPILTFGHDKIIDLLNLKDSVTNTVSGYDIDMPEVRQMNEKILSVLKDIAPTSYDVIRHDIVDNDKSFDIRSTYDDNYNDIVVIETISSDGSITRYEYDLIDNKLEMETEETDDVVEDDMDDDNDQTTRDDYDDVV